MANPTGNEATRQTANRPLGKTLSAFFLATSSFVAIGRFLGWPGQEWADALWVALGLAVTVEWMQRNLPLQNVLLAMATLTSLAFVATLVVEVGKPGSHLSLGLASTQGHPLSKYVQAAAWTLLLLSAQGVARLMATRKEKSPSYGFWMLGLAGALACVFQVGLEATVDSGSNKSWASKATMLVGWYCFALFCLALTSPALLKRKPGPSVVPVESAWVWLGLNLLLVATAANRGLWMVVAFQGAVTALGAWPALRTFGIR